MTRGAHRKPAEDPKAEGARAEAAQIAALKQRRAVSVSPPRRYETAVRTTASTGKGDNPPPPAESDEDVSDESDTEIVVSGPSQANAAASSVPRPAPLRLADAGPVQIGGTDSSMSRLDQRSPSTRLRRATPVWMKTSFAIPVSVADELRRMLIEERNNGRRKRIRHLINDAVLELPSEPDDLLDLIDTYGDELNIGVTAEEEGYKPETSVSVSITQEVNTHLSKLVERLYDRQLAVGRKTLVGVALVRLLRNGPGE